MQLGYLVLENGNRFEGYLPDHFFGIASGEVVFNTGMCGYPESLTDPSYSGQILVFTYPIIGNYGVSSSDSWESRKIQVSGVVVSESCLRWSHHLAIQSLRDWLKGENIPLLVEVDTRAVTKVLRIHGTMRGFISSTVSEWSPERYAPSFSYPFSSHEEKIFLGSGAHRLIAVDCGMKESMIRFLQKYPVEIVRVPHNYDYSEEDYDGVFLSNGPGDPIQYTKTIEVLQKAMKRQKPIFGVCLGSQMLALASGAKTYKLKFGHRGQNQPCVDLRTGKCYITSQNHGYAVDEQSLSDEWEVSFRNLNDQSVEGIAHRSLPFSAVQFHPEACPGPTDVRWLFERFYSCLQKKS